MHWTNLLVSIEAKYWVSWLSPDVYERQDKLSKLPLSSSFCTVAADSKSMSPRQKRIFAVSEMRHSQSSPRNKLHCCINQPYTEYISRYKDQCRERGKRQKQGLTKTVSDSLGLVGFSVGQADLSLARQASAVGNFHGSFVRWLDFGTVQRCCSTQVQVAQRARQLDEVRGIGSWTSVREIPNCPSHFR